jgi:hypothetical protein
MRKVFAVTCVAATLWGCGGPPPAAPTPVAAASEPAPPPTLAVAEPPPLTLPPDICKGSLYVASDVIDHSNAHDTELAQVANGYLKTDLRNIAGFASTGEDRGTAKAAISRLGAYGLHLAVLLDPVQRGAGVSMRVRVVVSSYPEKNMMMSISQNGSSDDADGVRGLTRALMRAALTQALKELPHLQHCGR